MWKTPNDYSAVTAQSAHILPAKISQIHCSKVDVDFLKKPYLRKLTLAKDPSWALRFPPQTPIKYITDQKLVVDFFNDFKLRVLLQPLMRGCLRVVDHILGSFVEEEPQESSSAKVSNMDALQGTKAVKYIIKLAYWHNDKIKKSKTWHNLLRNSVHSY
jgi:hypothetical protein